MKVRQLTGEGDDESDDCCGISDVWVGVTVINVTVAG